MASKALATMTLLLSLNLLFFTLVTSHYVPCPPPPKPKPICRKCPKPTPSPAKPPPSPSKPTPSSPPKPTPSPPKKDTCPIDTLKLAACANVLNGVVGTVIGGPSKTPCCSLIGGLADLDAAVCLCTAIKADVLGIHLNVPVTLSLLLNYCEKKSPSGFQCA